MTVKQDMEFSNTRLPWECIIRNIIHGRLDYICDVTEFFGLVFTTWKMLLDLLLILLGIGPCCVWHRSEIKKETSDQLRNSTNNIDKKTFTGSNLGEN